MWGLVEVHEVRGIKVDEHQQIQRSLLWAASRAAVGSDMCAAMRDQLMYLIPHKLKVTNVHTVEPCWLPASRHICVS
jgi:hypothetical protein